MRGNIMTACTEASPFTHPGCLTADESIITNTHRSAFCEKIDVSNGANPFTTGCPEREQLEVAKNDACLDFGDAANDSCKNRANVRSACNANPFATTTEGTAIELCTGMTADSGGETYQARQERMCTTGTEIFHERCDNAVYGMAVVDAARTARASLADTCRELASNSATSYICDNTYINGVDGLTVNACNLDVFATDNDCNTNAAFSAQRISICTTDATSFTAGCMDTIHGDVNDAQARFAAACADTSSQTVGCDTPITGVSGGTTVAACNLTPFAEGCKDSLAFETVRMGVCTTDATSFHASCSEATYTGTADARARFANLCKMQNNLPPRCDTTYLNGVDGQTIATCNANPFNTANDCATNPAFDAERTAREELCVATNDPFNTACENIMNVANFTDNNKAARDTYCGETALPAAGDTGGHCADRKAGICVTTTETATYNPFAPLCGNDSGIDTARGTFCNLDAQSANTNCGAVVATLCTANPFGTNLGTAANVDCTDSTNGTIYAGNRKALADACRDGTTLPAGTACTVAINKCNADPFNSANACDALAFANAQEAYCVKTANAWNMVCDTLDGSTPAVQQARGDVCIANGAITGASGGSAVAGASFFATICDTETGSTGTVADARIAHCVDDANAWNTVCDNLDGSDVTVQHARFKVCVENLAITGATNGDVAAGASLFDARCTSEASTDGIDTRVIATVRLDHCKLPANAWNANCDSYDTSGTNENADVVQARDTICLNNGAILKGATGGAGDVAAGQSLFHGDCTGSTLTVGETTRTIATEQLAHCRQDGNAWQDNCTALSMDGDSAKADAVTLARSNVCANNLAIVTGAAGGAGDVAAGASLFDTKCTDLTGADLARVTTAQETFCTGDNLFDTRCGALDRSGTAVGTTLALRATACLGTVASLGNKAPANACEAESAAICGTPTANGSAPFSEICEVNERNTNFAGREAIQQTYCRVVGNNALGACTPTIEKFCGPRSDPKVTETAVFNDLCLGAQYEAAQRTYCSLTAPETDGNCDTVQTGETSSIKTLLCDGAQTTDNPYATVCGTSNVTAQRTFCGLNTHTEDPTACVGTRMVACDAETGNPFIADLCFETGNTFGAARIKRADDCRDDGMNDNGDAVTCDSAVVTCNGAPFTAGCDAAVYVNALTAYCTEGANIFDTNCAETTTGAVDKIAGTLAARQKACEQTGDTLHVSVGTDRCASRALAICGTDAALGTNPFAAICTVADQNVGNAATHADAIVYYCGPLQGNQGSQGNALCTNITSVDWVESFVGGDALTTDPAGDAGNQTRNNEFLAITGDTISVVGTTTTDGGSTLPTPTKLNFTAIKYKTTELTNLPTINGLAFFTGYHGDDTEESAYAGIYQTADLGGPITERVTNATWHGALRILDGGDTVAADISLNVTFSGSAGFINAFETNINTGGSGNSLKDFYIVASFNDKGVITTDANFVYYGEVTDDDAVTNTPTTNGRLSGIIGQDGAIGVFVSNDTEALYTGGFVASGVCSTNIFAEDCAVKDDRDEQVLFCLNVDDNDGKNIFNPLCIEVVADGTVHGADGVLTGLRNVACLARGDDVDDSCKNRANVRAACNLNVYAEATATNAELCTGMTADVDGVAYSTRQSECETPGGTFANDWCNGGDAVAAVDTARDTFCRGSNADVGDSRCASRNSEICDTGSGASVFSKLCGIDTAAQVDACKGALNLLPVSGTSCARPALSGVICGNNASESGSNPFAPICESATENSNYANRVASRQLLCGNDRLGAGANKGNCDTLQDNLCDTAVKSLSDTMRGAGNFVCSTDDGPNVVLLRNSYCEDPATTYTTGCTNAVGADGTNVETTRKTLAAACVPGASKNTTAGSRSADCDKPVNGVSGTSVADCSANPYLKPFVNRGILGTEFATVLSTRRGICGITGTVGSDPFDTLCNVIASTNNAGKVDYCDESTGNAWQERCD